MGPDTAINELRGALEVGLMVASPMLLAVLLVGVLVGVIQAATQVNEPTIAFVAKAVALTVVMAALGAWMISKLVDFTSTLIQRIPGIIG